MTKTEAFRGYEAALKRARKADAEKRNADRFLAQAVKDYREAFSAE